MNIQITQNRVYFKWIGTDDNDPYEIEEKIHYEIEYTYKFPRKDEGFYITDVVIFAVYINGKLRDDRLEFWKNNDALLKNIADWLNKNWEDMQ